MVRGGNGKSCLGAGGDEARATTDRARRRLLCPCYDPQSRSTTFCALKQTRRQHQKPANLVLTAESTVWCFFARAWGGTFRASSQGRGEGGELALVARGDRGQDGMDMDAMPHAQLVFAVCWLLGFMILRFYYLFVVWIFGCFTPCFLLLTLRLSTLIVGRQS